METRMSEQVRPAVVFPLFAQFIVHLPGNDLAVVRLENSSAY